MADMNPIAALLLGQQRKRYDPFSEQATYGRKLMEQGSSMAPVQSPLEGLARALQGGVGGFFAGQAEGRAQERDTETTAGLADLLQADTGPKKQAAYERLKKADPEIAAAALTQLLGEKMADERKQQLGARAYGAVGGAPEAPTVQPVATGAQPSAVSGGTPSPDRAAFIQQMTPHVMAISQQTGLDPRLVMAQSALESGWGAAAPGNNYFGIKGPGQVLPTKEAGPGGLVQTQDSFRTYPDAGASAADYAQFVKSNPRYGPMLQAQGFDAQLQALGKSGYATDPNYASKIQQIAQNLPPFGATAPQAPQVAQGDNTQVAQAGRPQQGTQPQFDAGADWEALGKRAAAAGDFEAATKLQMKANEARIGAKTKQSEEGEKRVYEGGEYDRRQIAVNESKLRDDFGNLKPVKDYREANAVFRTAVEAAQKNTTASDLNLVYAFAKLMDPGSVVREGEMGMVVGTQAVMDRANALIATLRGGSRIAPQIKQELLEEMNSRFQAYKVGHDEMARVFTGITSRTGGNPQNVVVPYPDVPYTKREAPKRGQAPPKVGDVEDGYRFKGGNPADGNNWEPI